MDRHSAIKRRIWNLWQRRVKRTAHETCHLTQDADIRQGRRFELKPEDNIKASPVLKNAIKRMHINTGHSAPHDMARVIRQAGGSEDAVILAKRLRCSVCDRHKRPDPPRPIRPWTILLSQTLVIAVKQRAHQQSENAKRPPSPLLGILATQIIE